MHLTVFTLSKEYFPHASHQMLILSTDEEINSDLLSKVKALDLQIV